MATLEELEAQARNAARRLDNARKRADEKLGKRLRELVTDGESLNREVQDERAHAFLDEFFADVIAEQKARAEAKQKEREEKKKAKEAEAQQTEESVSHDEGADGQGYGGESQ